MYTLAKELRLDSKDLVDICTKAGVPGKGSALASYSFELPEDANGTVSVEAKLNYRSYDQGLADLLLGKGAVKVPVIEMAKAGGEIPLQ